MTSFPTPSPLSSTAPVSATSTGGSVVRALLSASLASKKRDTLQQLARELGLDPEGSKADLAQRVQAHLASVETSLPFPVILASDEGKGEVKGDSKVPTTTVPTASAPPTDPSPVPLSGQLFGDLRSSIQQLVAESVAASVEALLAARLPPATATAAVTMSSSLSHDPLARQPVTPLQLGGGSLPPLAPSGSSPSSSSSTSTSTSQPAPGLPGGIAGNADLVETIRRLSRELVTDLMADTVTAAVPRSVVETAMAGNFVDLNAFNVPERGALAPQGEPLGLGFSLGGSQATLRIPTQHRTAPIKNMAQWVRAYLLYVSVAMRGREGVGHALGFLAHLWQTVGHMDSLGFAAGITFDVSVRASAAMGRAPVGTVNGIAQGQAIAVGMSEAAAARKRAAEKSRESKGRKYLRDSKEKKDPAGEECHDWRLGRCTRGDTCKYAHDGTSGTSAGSESSGGKPKGPSKPSGGK
jgi:hypothetical protein